MSGTGRRGADGPNEIEAKGPLDFETAGHFSERPIPPTTNRVPIWPETRDWLSRATKYHVPHTVQSLIASRKINSRLAVADVVLDEHWDDRVEAEQILFNLEKGGPVDGLPVELGKGIKVERTKVLRWLEKEKEENKRKLFYKRIDPPVLDKGSKVFFNGGVWDFAWSRVVGKHSVDIQAAILGGLRLDHVPRRFDNHITVVTSDRKVVLALRQSRVKTPSHWMVSAGESYDPDIHGERVNVRNFVVHTLCDVDELAIDKSVAERSTILTLGVATEWDSMLGNVLCYVKLPITYDEVVQRFRKGEFLEIEGMDFTIDNCLRLIKRGQHFSSDHPAPLPLVPCSVMNLILAMRAEFGEDSLIAAFRNSTGHRYALGYHGRDALAEGRTSSPTPVLGRKDEQASAWKEGKRELNLKTATQLLNAFYRDPKRSSQTLKNCVVKVGALSFPTTSYSSPQYLNVNAPMQKLPMRLQSGVVPEWKLGDQGLEYADRIQNRELRSGVVLRNDPLFRLLRVATGKHLSFSFSACKYFDYRFGSNLVSDEVMDALIATNGDLERVLSGGLLRLRNQLFPTLDSFLEFSKYTCAGGPVVLFAMARKRPRPDFCILLQTRSSQVTDAKGLCSVIPQGFHQPCVDIAMEVNAYWTILRETYEELFGGKDAEACNQYVRHDWYAKKCPGVEFFLKKPKSYVSELTALSFSVLNGTYDMAALVAISDPSYWEKFGYEMRAMWESARLLTISTLDKGEIERVLSAEDWTSEGRIAVVKGLLRLKQIDPKRVSLPDIEVFLSGQS